MAESNAPSLSRVENILRATLGYEDIVDYDERSRVETLLIELKETIEAGGGGSGTTNYNSLTNKPELNGVIIKDSKTFEDYGAKPISSAELSAMWND